LPCVTLCDVTHGMPVVHLPSSLAATGVSGGRARHQAPPPNPLGSGDFCELRILPPCRLLLSFRGRFPVLLDLRLAPLVLREDEHAPARLPLRIRLPLLLPAPVACHGERGQLR
jgi:hypothetical protein